MLNYPEISEIPPTIGNVLVNNNLVTVEVFNSNKVELMATISDYNSKFISFTMNDNATNGDLFAGDNIYSCILPFYNQEEIVKFYVRAQNNEAMQLKPQRAEYEFYIYEPNSVEIMHELVQNKRKLIKVVDILGREIGTYSSNLPIIKIYDDGTVEKQLKLN